MLSAPAALPGPGSAAGTDPSAPPADDKNQYNLFNPTPDSAMRPFCTDRPGKSHCAQTVDAGHFQYEGDIWNYTWDHWSPTGTTTRVTLLGTPNLKLGLTNWAEFDVITALYTDIEVRGPQGNIVRGHGVGDTYLGGKVNFFGNDGGDQSMGAIFFVKVPTAAANVGDGAVEYTINVPFTTALPHDFSLTVEPAFGLLRNAYKSGYEGDRQIIFNLSRPIIGQSVIAALEFAFDWSTDHNYGPRHTFDPSLQWLVTPNLQLDAGAYIGMTRAAPDYNPYVGISFRY